MQLEEFETSLCIKKEEISFSGLTLMEVIQATLAKGCFFRFKVKGFSMSPFIKDGDIVTLSRVSNSKAQPLIGKPVAYFCPAQKRLMIHRLIGRKGKYYLIKGDNIPETDCLIEKDNLLGRVIRIERENKITHFSLGWERIIIAFLSRNGLLPLVFSLWRLIPKSLRILIKCRILL